MNSVAPSRRASARERRLRAPAGSRGAAPAPRYDCTGGRGRSVGQLERRRARPRAAPSSRRAAARAPRPRATGAARRRSRRTGPAASGSGEGCAGAERAVERAPARARRTPRDQPSETMWCSVRRSTWSSAREPQQARRGAAGRAPRSKGRRASAAAASAQRRLALRRGQRRRGPPPAGARSTVVVDHLHRPARPTAAKVVRSTSCRRTISRERALERRARRAGRARRSASGTL